MIRWFPILLLGVLTGCPDNPIKLCESECALGEVCDVDVGVCVPAPLQTYDGPFPGRDAKTAGTGNKVFYAAVDPVSFDLIAGTLTRSDRDIRILTRLSNSRSIAMNTNASRVVVVWLGDDSRFRFATRTQDADLWTFGVAEADVAYAGTENFAVALDEAGGLTIAFQATDRTLRVVRSNDRESWTAGLVDDGGVAANGVECPAAIRGTRRPGGVGIQPSMVQAPDGVWIAYQDADCGDLRLARQVGTGWSVDVVDTGAIDASPVTQRGRTGGWSTMAVGPSGNVGIAYVDELRGTLKYVSASSLSFVIETVDDGFEIDANANQRKDVVGAWAHLDFDSRGAPTIVYMNQSNASLRLAQRPQEGSRWVQRTVASDGIVGFHAGLVELAQGRLISGEQMVPGRMSGSSFVQVWE